MDLPKLKYGGKISRDGWIARSIAEISEINSNAKMLIVAGNDHVLKKLDWQNQVINKHGSIRQYLSEMQSDLRIFSVEQVAGESIYEDDFRD